MLRNRNLIPPGRSVNVRAKDLMRVLVTGAAGRLGSWVVQTLTGLQHDLIATDRRATRVGIVQCDLSDLTRVTELCRGVEAVVHLATSGAPDPGRPQPSNTLANNLRATTNVAKACLANGVRRLVYASSIQVIAANSYPHLEVAYLPLDGSSPPNPRNPYGVAKLAEETVLRELSAGRELDVVTLRFPALYRHIPGAHAGRRLLPLSRAERPSDLAEGLSCLSFQDAARLVAACLEATLPGYRTYLPAVSVVPPEWVPEYVARYYPAVELRVPLHQLRSLVDLSELARDVGWEPLDLPLHAPPLEAHSAALADPPASLATRVVQRVAAWQERRARNRRLRFATAQLAEASGPVFSTDYVSLHASNWIQLFHQWRDRPDVRFLEVGCHDGRAAIWFLENVLTHPSARLTCVVRFGDPVLGLRFDHNLRVTGSRDRVIRLEGPSTDVLPTLPAGGFSAVYLDGSHRGPDFQDAINGWRLLQSGGVLLFDGYYWERLPSDVLGSKAEMERFLEMIEGQGEVLLREYQLAVRKA